eukprot:scaffold14717_cov168-Ochromonas_danica.AAC.7
MNERQRSTALSSLIQLVHLEAVVILELLQFIFSPFPLSTFSLTLKLWRSGVLQWERGGGEAVAGCVMSRWQSSSERERERDSTHFIS